MSGNILSYTDSSAILYDDSGKDFGAFKIRKHNIELSSVELHADSALSVPDGLLCNVLILSNPTPRIYSGRVYTEGRSKVVKLFKGRDKESRTEARYPLSLSVEIESIIYGNKIYPLHTPVESTLINISQNGIRIRTKYGALIDSNRFRIRFKVKEMSKMLIADVVNRKDVPPEYSEFGCRLVDSEGVA